MYLRCSRLTLRASSHSRPIPWLCYTLLSCATLRKRAGMRPSSSPSEAIPTVLLKQVIDALGPKLLLDFNHFLSPGYVPDDFKMTCVQPHLKKLGLDLLV